MRQLKPNLSTFVLNDAGIHIGKGHKEILEKGLSFIPTALPKGPTQTLKELNRLRRLLNLRVHWGLHDNPLLVPSLLSQHWKSPWEPPQYFTHSEHWQLALKEMLTHTPCEKNLSESGKKAWKNLLTTDDVYTLKADKGGKTVTWSKANYLKEANRQLADPLVYQELGQEDMELMLQTILTERNSLAWKLRKGGYITSKDLFNIKKRPAKASAIYFLPKIHKDQRPDTGTFPGRPILAATNSSTRDIDLFLADLTKPLLRRIPGSLQDTTSLINDMESLATLPQNCNLFSADVVSLYPNIPWDEGIASATKFYATHFYILTQSAAETNRLGPPNPRLFREMLTLVIKRNIIHLQNRRWFQQISGTAMGCSISVYFANTFMYYRTEHLIRNPPTQLLYLGRYIDDLIGIWHGNKDEIIPAFDRVVDNSLQLTFVISDDPLEALDLKLAINQGKIECTLYRKPTDGHQYVRYDSMHPPALLKSIPFSQLLRAKRNSTHAWNFDKEAAALLQRLQRRGYPSRILLSAYTRAILLRRRTLLNPNKPGRSTSDRLTFITGYFSSLKNTGKALARLFKSLTHQIATYNTLLRDRIPIETPRIAYCVGRRIGDGLGRPYKQGQAHH